MAVGVAAVGVGVCCACLFACLFGIRVAVRRSALADSCTGVRAGGGGNGFGCVGSWIGIAGALVSAGFGVAGLVVCFWSLERRIWYADCWLLCVVVSDGDGMLLADCLLCC